jgi:hypothetical protein
VIVSEKYSAGLNCMPQMDRIVISHAANIPWQLHVVASESATERRNHRRDTDSYATDPVHLIQGQSLGSAGLPVLRIVHAGGLFQSLVDRPLQGSFVADYEDPNVRERLLGRYRFIYRVEDEFVTLLLIRHGARLLPPEPPPAAN